MGCSSSKNSGEIEINEKKLTKLLKKHNVDRNPEVNENYHLQLDLKSNSRGVHEFLEEMKFLKFPELRKMSLTHMYELSQEGKINCRHFFLNSCPQVLQVLYLEAGDWLLDIHSFEEGLPNLLNAVRKQVYLKSWCFEGDSLQIIFNNSLNSQQIVFDHCNVGDFFEGFGFNVNQPYSINHLSLFGTASKKVDLRLNEEKLKILIEELAKTPIKESLKTIHVKEDEYPAKKVKKLFDDFGFEVEVTGNDEDPVLLD